MASKRSNPDYETRYLDSLEDELKEIKQAFREDLKDIKQLLGDVHEQTKRTNGRVTKLEGETKALNLAVFKPPAKKDLPSFIRDPKVIQTLFYFSISILLIVGYITKFDVAGLLR